MTVVVDRAGSRVPVAITPAKTATGRFILGVMLQYKFTFPFDVKISLDKVGGPSAGMMFALGIIDTVTPGDLTGGKHIAGTGTITPDGVVGPIGGIGQKMQGARSGGATMFLAPGSQLRRRARPYPGRPAGGQSGEPGRGAESRRTGRDRGRHIRASGLHQQLD